MTTETWGLGTFIFITPNDPKIEAGSYKTRQARVNHQRPNSTVFLSGEQIDDKLGCPLHAFKLIKNTMYASTLKGPT